MLLEIGIIIVAYKMAHLGSYIDEIHLNLIGVKRLIDTRDLIPHHKER
jgi:hypothetical protein